MTLDGKILRGLFEQERLKLANIRMSQGNICNLVQLKQVIEYRNESINNSKLINYTFIYVQRLVLTL